ncbi:MAG: alpha-glucan family phosphorylase [Candidatus Omnitrophica bacterium]|jgi:starch phosphorylase|nr:alpha-glucan family phosphorylase [Candidatus Omnitrophota bacterium]MDD5078188.1 alpha-glucan family phosphorylase [Candidatus Omnitrophota bacterium]
MENGNLIEEFYKLVQVDDPDGRYAKEIKGENYFNMPLEAIVKAERRLREEKEKCIAYFSMEYGLATSCYNKFTGSFPLGPANKMPENAVFSNFRVADYFFALHQDNILDLPIYSGGLGVLAGDTVKTMADYKLPVAALGILWNSGYFRQKFWFKYGQAPEKMRWDPYAYPGLIPLKNRIKVSLKPEEVELRLWKYYVYSRLHDAVIPLVLLDSNIESNSERGRLLTDQLYRSDNVFLKLLQRVMLGFGGVKALDNLGYKISTYHLNEGHAIFAFVARARGLDKEGLEDLKKKFVYTCHTPVEAGHDRFSFDDLNKVLNPEDTVTIENFGKERPGLANLTLLSMNISSAINAVAHNHQKVMHIQFPAYKERIQYVTNGVHPPTWMSESFGGIFEKFPEVFKDFRSNPMILADAVKLKDNADFRAGLWQAHQENKTALCKMLEKWKLDRDIFTVCWARRIAAYKRPSLILHDIGRLARIADEVGPLQVIMAGKAHPNDNLGFTYINEMLDKVDRMTQNYDKLKIIVLENYDISLGKKLTSSVDVWLNNPLPPFEASGTSGMKAILNGVLQMSTVDGWVAEATDKKIGAFFGYQNKEGQVGNESDLHMNSDAEELYGTLQKMVGLYYQTNQAGNLNASSAWIDMMIECLIAAAYFNTYRMVDQYKEKIWKIT